MKRILREPLGHFLLAGAALFLWSQVFGARDARRITVSPDEAATLVRQQQEILGRSLTAAERDQVVRRFVDGEILVREAYALGLDQGDSRIRERLIERMRFLLDEEPPPPSEEQLRGYLNANASAYSPPELRTIDQVTFPADSRLDPDSVLGRLAGGDGGWAEVGSRTPVPARIPPSTPRALEQALGPDFAEAVFDAEPGAWTGPVPSPYGVHFFRVVAVDRPPPVSFDQIRPRLQADWEAEWRISHYDSVMTVLRAGYRIQLPDSTVR